MVDGRVMYFARFVAQTVNRVIVGAKAPAEFEREVRKYAALHGIGNERIMRAGLNIDRYTVEVD